MQAKLQLVKWDEEPMAQKSADYPVNNVHAEYELSGDLTGKATVDYYLFYLLEDGHNSVALTSGLFAFSGNFKGATGNFVATESGRFDKGTLASPGTIVHADGGLAALKGRYTYSFDSQGLSLELDVSLSEE